MDVSLCSYDKSTNILKFSGAVNPLFLIRDGELIEYKGEMWSIGQVHDVRYKSIEIDIKKGDIGIYV